MSEASTSGVTRYVVQSGDSLMDIAQAVYGDSALWYAIADANSVTTAPSDPLPTSEVGKAYEIPATIRSTHSASTFTPYQAALVMGNDRPIEIPPPPPPKHSEIDEILVAAAEISVQVGVSAGLSALGVPAPISAAIGAGLGNLVGQEAAEGLGMQAPGHHGIDWQNVGISAAEGYFFSLGGRPTVFVREVWQQNKNNFEGWTSGPGLNLRGISGSMFNVGFGAKGPDLPGLTVGQVNFGLGGFINSALNPSSGWAVPGTGKTAAVGVFEYAYSAVANGAANMGYSWIRSQLEQPSAAPTVPRPRSVDERGPLPAELLDQWDEEDRRYTDELDSMAQWTENEQITAASKQRLQLQLQLNAARDLVDSFGADIDDRAIIRATLRQQMEERVLRQKAAIAAARERRMAKQRADAAKLEAQKKEIIGELLALSSEVSKMMTSSDMQYLRDHALALRIDAQEAIMNAEQAAGRASESARTARRFGIALRAAKVAGGAVEATVGALACPTTGLGCVMAAHGVDTFVSGVRGERSLTARIGTLVTQSERGGDYVDALTGLALGFGTSEATFINLAESGAPEATALGIASKATPVAEAEVNVAAGYQVSPTAEVPSQPAPLAPADGVPAWQGTPTNPGRGLIVSPGAGYFSDYEPLSDFELGMRAFRDDSPAFRGFQYRSGLIASISDPGEARFTAANAAIAYATREGAPTIRASSLGTIGMTESKPYFRLLALREITSDPVSPMAGVLRGGRFLQSTARGIGAPEWLENPLYLEAGHGNSARGLGSPGAQTAAGGLRLQTAYLNRLQSATIEHPSVGGIARNPAALSIGRVPVDVVTARDLAAFGVVDPDAVAISPLIWFDF
jgi:hypothetical protein